jgi:hypothetical protein
MTRLLALILLALFVTGCATPSGQRSGPSFQDKRGSGEGGGNGGMGGGHM